MRTMTLVMLVLLAGSVVALYLFSEQVAAVLATSPTSALAPLFGVYPSAGLWLERAVAEISVGLVSALLLALLLRRPSLLALQQGQARPLRSLLLGSGVLFTLPALLALVWVGLLGLFSAWALGLTAISALVGLGANTAVATLGGLVFAGGLLIGRVIAWGSAARWVLRGQLWRGPQIELLALALGAVLAGVLASLPLIGWLMGGVSALIGLGALLLALTPNEQAAPVFPELEARYGEAPRLPPRISDDPPTAPGAENLPSGFTWWE